MTIESHVRTLAKWLNEEQTAPIDCAALACVLAAVQEHQATEKSLHREPIGYINPNTKQFEWAKPISFNVPLTITVPKIPLYINPVYREWQELTRGEIESWGTMEFESVADLVWFVESKIKEKNQ